MHRWLKLIAPIFLCSTLGSLFLTPNVAYAQGTDESEHTPAYVVTLTNDESLQNIVSELDHVLRTTLSSQENYSLTTTDNMLYGLDANAIETLQQARELFESGRVAYDNLELDEAVELFEQAIAAYEEQIAHLSFFDEITTCFLYLGAAQVLGGNTRAAIRSFYRLLLVDPERRPDENLFPPRVTEAFQNAVVQLNRAREGPMKINSTPVGDAYVDGVYQGQTPQKLRGIKAGTHYVRVRARSHVEAGQRVKVRPRRGASVNLTLERTDEGTAIDEMITELSTQLSTASTQTVATVQRLGQTLGVEVLATAFVTQTDEGITIQFQTWNVAEGAEVHSQTSGPFEANGLVIAGDAQPVFEELLVSTWTTMNVRQEVDLPITDPRPPLQQETSNRPVWRRWWFWTIIGTVVVGTGVGLGVGLGLANQEPEQTNGEVIFDL